MSFIEIISGKVAKVVKQLVKSSYLFIALIVILLKVKNNPLSAHFTKWSNALQQFVNKLPTNCLSVFDHFVGLTLKGLTLYCYSEDNV